MEGSLYPNMSYDKFTGEAQRDVAPGSMPPPPYGSPIQAQPTLTAVVDISRDPEPEARAHIPTVISNVIVGQRTSRECNCCCPCCYCTCPCPGLPCWAWFLTVFAIVLVLALVGMFVGPHPLIPPPPPPPPMGPSMFDQEASKMIALT